MSNRSKPSRAHTAGGLRAVLLAAALAATSGIAACGGDGGSTTSTAAAPSTIPQPSEAQLAAAGLDELPVAAESERVDITAPTFSNPTEITNPLFPISDLHSAIFSGRIEGEAFHTETTLLPQTRTIEWSPGQQVEALISQYTAYIDGRIEEVALDYYAQADDGSVWYLGEEVFDYDPAGFDRQHRGNLARGQGRSDRDDHARRPAGGDVHRAENIPGIAFEEVAIKSVDETVDGPTGPVEGAMIARELHDDGTFSGKVFAPGYGEFFSGHGREIEAMALAVPTDAIDGPAPNELQSISTGARELLHATLAGDWKAATNLDRALSRDWDAYPRGVVPPRIGHELDGALAALDGAIGSRNKTEASTAAVDVAQSAVDLELRYEAPAEIDLSRFELWARQVLVDAAAGDAGGVRSAITAMEWTRDRFAGTLNPADLTAIDAHLIALRDAVANEAEDLETASVEARLLRRPLQLGPVPPRD